MTINWDGYSTIAIIDSNVLLECLALEQLPWREIDKTGRILVLITPTVVQEVDSKKSHARLGDHARRFNRTLSPLLMGNQFVNVRANPAPQVDLALADCGAIEWSNFPDLDRDEPDARVALQGYCARGPNLADRILISHDIRPLYLGQQLGLRVHKIGDNWLRPKELSESDKKLARLQREVDSLKSREPKLEVIIESSPAQVDSYRFLNLPDQEREEIKRRIIDSSPKPSQERSSPLAFNTFDYDSSLDDRYERWESEIVSNFVSEYEQKLELNFGQVEIQFRLKNIGQVPAENLLVRLTATGGWLHDKHVLVSPAGPRAPSPRHHHLHHLHGMFPRNVTSVTPGQHEFVIVEKPDRASEVEVTCLDFRHGYEYEYDVIAWVDPRSNGLSIEAIVTASNLHGEVRGDVSVAPKISEVEVSELIDLKTLKFRVPPPVAELLKDATERRDFSAIEFDGANWDR
ncbi:hypothetical protein D0T25_31990 [Duganella sp. BJB488]|uniref:PIN domain-containing protein n=1 Tax=unclassified Duganella TaxID=2636909 RepID=UPI000E344955|nr:MULTISPECIES: PIN domain-containing protein [unclassified Duganella]RFP08374.1 hypothetical protein D0T26_31940 [Duganella sp. BJB489]RFP10565.1 hypothetical protein D0T25_31990 [Duganella sp. BJB488]RFP27426.1 hypothetical protein D0T24_31975 [Duganella sp. BJB480]